MGESEVDEDARLGCREPRRERREGESSPESLLWSNEWCGRTSSFVTTLEPRSIDRADRATPDGLLGLSPFRLAVRKLDTLLRNWVVRSYRGEIS